MDIIQYIESYICIFETYPLMFPSLHREHRPWGCHNNPETQNRSTPHVSKRKLSIYEHLEHLADAAQD